MLPGGLTPTDVIAWYDAEQGGPQVDPLPDISGNGMDIAQSDPTKQAIWLPAVFNGKAAYEFGAPRVYKRQWSSISEPFTLFLVTDIQGPLNIGLSYCLASGWNGAGKHAVGIRANGTQWLMEQAGEGQHIYSGKRDTAAYPQNGVTYVLQADFDATDGLSKNGVAIISGDAGHNPTTGLTLGARENEERHWPGRIAVCGIAPGLSTAQKDAVRADLLAAYVT